MVCHGFPYRHLFDGDGMVQRFFFDGTEVRYTNRIDRTPELAAEAAAGRMLYRSFGTNRPGGVAALLGSGHISEPVYRDFYPGVIGEPLFVADSRDDASEDSGWLLCLGFDPKKTKGFLRILNAENLETVATLGLPEPVHPGFHGAWIPAG